ncbi:MAG: TetR/AcrR family transcriptional regulator [Limisphaerales bacterium]
MSVTQARKDRERAEREVLILDHAHRLLARDGFQDLNLDELAAAVEYSKGTLYLHFESKEDLTLAIATRVARERADLFERASRFQGRSRERIRAIGFACCQFAIMHRDYFNVEMMLKSVSFWEKASAERRRQHGVQVGRLFQTTNAIVIEAQAVGDLPREHPAPDVTLSLFAVTMGSHIMAMQPDIQMLAGMEDPIRIVRQNQDRICDGWRWVPLIADWDYAATDRRIRDEIFPEATWLENP